MALTDQRIIQWSDQRARTIADAAESLLTKLLAYQADYAAQGIAALIVAGGGAGLVQDTAVTGPDGRQQVSGNQIGPGMKGAVDQMVTAMTVTVIPVIGVTVKAVIDQVQVNGSYR